MADRRPVLSLVVNLLLVGFVTGRMSGSGHGPGWARTRRPVFSVYSGFCATNAAPRSHRICVSKMRDLIPVLRRMRGNQRHVFETLTAEPFDPAALEAGIGRPAHGPDRRPGLEPPVVRRGGKVDDARRTQVLADAMRQGARMHRGRSSVEGSRHGDLPSGSMGSRRDRVPSGKPLATAQPSATAWRRLFEHDLAGCVIHRQEQIGFGFRARKKHRERRAYPPFRKRMPDQIFDQPIESGGFHSRIRLTCPSVRGRFEAAGPERAVVRFDVRVDRRFQRALETCKIVGKRAA